MTLGSRDIGARCLNGSSYVGAWYLNDLDHLISSLDAGSNSDDMGTRYLGVPG